MRKSKSYDPKKHQDRVSKKKIIDFPENEEIHSKTPKTKEFTNLLITSTAKIYVKQQPPKELLKKQQKIKFKKKQQIKNKKSQLNNNKTKHVKQKNQDDNYNDKIVHLPTTKNKDIFGINVEEIFDREFVTKIEDSLKSLWDKAEKQSICKIRS